MKNNSLITAFSAKKGVLYPSILVVLSVFLILGVILPQLASLSETNLNIDQANSSIKNLKNSISTVSSQSNIEPLIEATGEALPTTKNVALIFNTLLSAAGATGVQIEEFSLKVGGIYGRAERANLGVKGTPTVDVVARVIGDANGFVNFSNEIQENLPLAEVSKIDSVGGKASFQISFFYKPLDLADLSEKEVVVPLSQDDLEVIQKLEDWQN